ncbi:MAG: DUF3060 domain-containing protein [Armatimonadetes bacterium]|nr:DUF3060 domain-containing protein [Armatimonadota bacterium]
MVKVWIASVAAVLVLCAASAASAESVFISGPSKTETYQADGKTFYISGSGHVLTLVGRAQGVNLSGSGNTVHVDEAEIVNVSGSGNRVYCKRGNPHIAKSGTDNQVLVSRAPESPGGDGSIVAGDGGHGTVDTDASNTKVEINGYGIVKTYAGGGRSFEVNGTGQRITITGAAGRIEVNGTDNQVNVEEATAIDVDGMNNTVTYKRGNPEISESGLNNAVKRQ